MAKKTYLQKLQTEISKTHICTENDVVIVYDGIDEIHILDSETATSSTIIGLSDFLKTIKLVTANQ